MATKMYVLISWPDGSRVINIENIKEPRKPFHLYAVGEQVLARCPGFSGLYWGVVEGISEHKCILEKKLQEDKEILDRLEEQPAVQNLGSPQPRKSRKSFPKWNSGNSSRNCPSDEAKMTEEGREADCQHHLASFLDPREECDMGIMMRSHPSKPRIPHMSSPFNVSSHFLTISSSGTSQRSTTRLTPAIKDCAAIAKRKRLDYLPAQCQKRFVVSREEKIEQLERMVFSLRREVLSLKQKVQHLEAGSFKDQEPSCQPCEVSELFNGYTREELKEAIRFDQKISTACKTLLYKLFTSDYIQSHSITGRRGNTFREAKPMMDERCIKIIRILLKEKFGDHLSDTVITEKIQNVQKALRQKFKMECA